ncbi:hypothetical protein AB1Y20_021386 [Prymnesium parvum]|uniref:Leucine-rich repeat-containing protein 56 n=1 Tax=Prymnesium parvum TaxID=97485 RepID=A0AB34JLW0_PRYPA
MDTITEEFLPDEMIRKLAGTDDLSQVTFLEMTVDTSEHTLGDLGVRLPRLEQLRLSHSNIGTPRDLGTALGRLQVLWLARSGLHELEGVGAFGSLTELYLAFNAINDLSPLMDMERLQVIDLEANTIADPAQVHYLCGCSQLGALTLEGNPIADCDDYREQVTDALPWLQWLDDRPTNDDKAAKAARAVLDVMPCEKTRRELRLITDGIKYADPLRAFDVMSFEALSFADTASAPLASTSSSFRASSRGGTSRGSAQPVGVAWGSSHGSSSVSTPRGVTTSSLEAPSSATSTSSSLTHGDGILVCGNPTQALRAKRRADSREASPLTPSHAPSPFASLRLPLPPSLPLDTLACDDLLPELLQALYQFKLQQAMLGDVELDQDAGYSRTLPASVENVGVGGTHAAALRESPGGRGPIADDATWVTGVDGIDEADDVLLLDVPSLPSRVDRLRETCERYDTFNTKMEDPAGGAALDYAADSPGQLRRHSSPGTTSKTSIECEDHVTLRSHDLG